MPFGSPVRIFVKITQMNDAARLLDSYYLDITLLSRPAPSPFPCGPWYLGRSFSHPRSCRPFFRAQLPRIKYTGS